MKKQNVLITLCMALLIGLFSGSTFTYAEETKKDSVSEDPSGVTGFTYQVVYPTNQNDESGFFDLRMTPGQKQTVEIKLKNSGTKELTVGTTLSGAKTNPNGVIEYGPNKLSDDASMKYLFKDVVKAPKSVTIKPQSEESLKLDISMPETSFDGIILGGIQLQRKSEDKGASDNNGTMVINEYAYVIGIRLQETDKELPVELNFVKAYASAPDYRNTIVIDLGNTQAAIMSDLTVEAQIMGEKEDSVLFETKKTNMRMAPNSLLNFPVSMDGQAMKSGKYRAHVVATSGEKKWEWTEAFEITPEEAEKFNKEAVGLIQERGMNWQLIALIVGGVVFVIVVLFFIIHFVTKKKKQQKKAKKKKRPVSKK